MKKATLILWTCLILAYSSVAWAGQKIQAPVTLTFDELPFQPVDGLSFQGVTFGFTIGGVPSTDANYNSGGPGIITYVQDPSLEGNAAGILTLDFDVPTSVVQFGVALSTFGTLTPGFSVELFDPDLQSLGVFDVTTTSLISFTEAQFRFDSALVSRVVISFNSAAAQRFAFDNLTFDDGNPNSAPAGSPWAIPKSQPGRDNNAPTQSPQTLVRRRR